MVSQSQGKSLGFFRTIFIGCIPVIHMLRHDTERIVLCGSSWLDGGVKRCWERRLFKKKTSGFYMCGTEE